MKHTHHSSISPKEWLMIWLLVFSGQICWAVENNTFATYALAKTGDPDVVTWMVALSAAASTVAAFISGTLGDRKGRRKKIISIGFILWGIFTAAFGMADFIPQNEFSFLAVYVVAMDSVMSFFGSFGYSGGVNPWTTDISDETNRGSVSAVVSSMTIIANIVILGLQGFVVEKFGFLPMFLVIGIFILIMGFLSLVMVKDSPDLKPSVSDPSFWKQLLEAFNFKETFANPTLFWMLTTLCVYTIGTNIFMSYMTSYLWIFFPIYSGIALSKGMASVFQGVGMLAGVLLSVFFIKPINHGKAGQAVLWSVLFTGVSLIAISFSKTIVTLLIFIIGTSLGYVLCILATTAWFKNLSPADKRGQLEGVRQIFYNMIPMVIGPMIAGAIIKKINYVVEADGVSITTPTNQVFLAAGLFTFLTLIPLMIAIRKEKKQK